MEGRKLLQYIIDISDVALPKKQEATEYLAKLEAAQQSLWRTKACPRENLHAVWRGSLAVCSDCGKTL